MGGMNVLKKRERVTQKLSQVKPKTCQLCLYDHRNRFKLLTFGSKTVGHDFGSIGGHKTVPIGLVSIW